MHYNRHISYDMSGNIIHITLPQYHDKHDKCGRTCRNCTNMRCRSDFKCGCGIYGYDDPARNPRTRALKCKHFEHWRKALEQFIF